MFSLKSPHRGDSNEYTQYTIINIKETLTLQLWDFSEGLKNEFETAMVNEPSVLEPLEFYCYLKMHFHIILFAAAQVVLAIYSIFVIQTPSMFAIINMIRLAVDGDKQSSVEVEHDL